MKTTSAAETAPADDKGNESEKKKQKPGTQQLCERFQNLNLLKIQEQLHKDFFSAENFTLMLYDVASVLGAATSSDDFSLYMVEPGGNEISLYQPNLISDRQKLTEAIDDSTTVSAFAAFSKAPVFIEDMHADERFPQGAGLHREDTYSVLSFPLVLQNGDLLAVIELIRNAGSSSFTKREMQLGICFMGITGLAIEKSQQCHALTKQQELNDFLLHASHLIVEGTASVDALISHIMSFTKCLVTAERCTFFLLDKQTEELYCSLFDEGDKDADGKDVFCKKPEVRFSIKYGIAGYVARTQEILNIKNAYEDPRFNREFDKESGYTTRCILCMPILSGDSVLGVVQMINKTGGGIFTNADEQTFKVFAVYCSLAIHYSNLATSSADLKNRYQVQLDKLVYHTKCSEDDYEKLMARPLLKRLPPGFNWFEFYVNKYVADIPQLFIHMVHHLFGNEIVWHCFLPAHVTILTTAA